MPAILMIDDDTGLCELVAEYLALDGFEFTAAHDGRQGLTMAQSADFELILLDIMLPGMDGLSVLKQLRSGRYCPVLMLTARGDDVDRIVGLELGADDYLAKPFNPRELVARIKAILRRVELTKAPQPGQNTVLTLNGLELNPHNRQLSCNSQPVNLTATEFQLLELLMRRAGEVISKDELSREVLGKRLQMYDRSLDMHISNIRKKIAPFSAGEKIQTLRGSGYLFLTGEHMSWLARLNPFRYLAGRIFLWFWLVLLTAVFGTLALSRALIEQTEIRRLPHSVIQQLQKQIQPFTDSATSSHLLTRLEQDRPGRWLLVNTGTNTVLTPELLPPDFDQHWLTELSQLSRPRWLKHHNMSLAGPFVLQVGNDTLALYQKRERPPQPWWRLSEMPQHVLLAFTLIISAVASFILAVSISRPLRELLQRNLQFADGQLQSRVTSLSKRQDELGQLGRSFNTMAERISALLTNQQRLLRDISHELRSPLARAQLALGLAERQQTLEQVPRLKQELDRVDAMLDELLTFSKLDAGQYHLQKQPFDLPELLTDIIEVNQVEADAKQQLIQLTAPPHIQIVADSRLLARAVENVLRNAIKYSPPASRIDINLQQHTDYLVLSVCDQGPGIAQQQLEAVFEPFYRVSNSRNTNTGGTGLGLAIVAQIARQHGGQVQAANNAAGGLCITLRLPVN